jgi:hypothetical protein
MPVTYTTYTTENSSLNTTHLSFVKLSDSRGINPVYEVTASYKWHTYNVEPRPVTISYVSCNLLFLFLYYYYYYYYVSNRALLALVFTNITDLRVSLSNYPVVATDKYNPPIHLDFKLTSDSQLTFLTPLCNYGQGCYLFFIIPYLITIGRVSLMKILLILQFIVLLLVCLMLLMKPFRLYNLKILTSLSGFRNLLYTT